WHNGFDNGWSGWERIGGMLTDAPAATARATGPDAEVLALGADSAVHLWQGEATERSVSKVRIHAKVLAEPDVPVAESVARMTRVYGAAGISVELASTEELDLPGLKDVDVGQCTVGRTTSEQEGLFAHRSGADGTDVVVYFVRSTVPPLNGCAAHPPGLPSVVVAQGATAWTLAHEVGHVLGLRHVDDNDRLMTGNGTRNITNPPPELVPDEVGTVVRSRFSLEP
ncbi:hypothetical protein, partial [Streptomyces cinereoruber]|uniref:hypothetical protein n=1 Tax=Streptomyces cinereoruber TaxID=67260 RepID=UPI003632F59F